MVIVTLVGELQAKKNESFIYCGPISECRECKLKTVCFNLEVGKRYRVTSVRDVHHDCKIHQDGVRVVEVENTYIPAAVQSKMALEGASITFDVHNCENLSCTNYRLCNPFGVASGTKFKIVKVENEIDCEKGLSLRRVMLS